jgi:methyl-galactoside transport system substrate-binding protein
LTFNGKIEAIISNNDNMAIGAVEALQKYGFNKGDSSKYIPVVGIGGVPEAKKLIDQGFMTGTAVQDSKLHAKAIYDVAVNLASEKDPLYGTDYKFDETGITIKIPYYEYVK